MDFTTKPKPELDISKIKYNAFYRSYEFAESRFPKGYDNIPGFDKVIQAVADNLSEITPLEEIEFRQKINLS